MKNAITCFLILICLSVTAQPVKSKPGIPPPPPPPIGTVENTAFGKYYKIADYNILVPFHDYPHVSPKEENEFVKYTSYQYAYPKSSDDVNLVYGIDICEYKKDRDNHTNKLDSLAKNIRKMYEKIAKGVLIKQEVRNTDKQYIIKQLIKISFMNNDNTYVTSYFVLHNGMVIRLFTMTANGIENKRIEEFFRSVKFN